MIESVMNVCMELGVKVISAGMHIVYGIQIQVDDETTSKKEIYKLKMALEQDGRGYMIYADKKIIESSMTESLRELIEELEPKIMSLKESDQIDITINGNLMSPKEIVKLRKELDNNEKPYNWTMKGSAYEKEKS